MMNESDDKKTMTIKKKKKKEKNEDDDDGEKRWPRFIQKKSILPLFPVCVL